MEIKEALTEEEIIACFPVVMELGTDIPTEEELVTNVKLQNEMGFRLMYIKDKETNKVASICGFRITNYLYTGKTLYIDDLCTLPFARGSNSNSKMINQYFQKHCPSCIQGRGHGRALIDWTVELAKNENCNVVSLDR